MAIDLDGPNSAINVNTIETHSGSTLTIGKSGDTVSLGSGASASGFSKDGAITWDSSIKTANTSITTGTGFFVDTTSAAITITLPASPSVGNIVGIKDYAGTFGTNNLTIARNGSNIQGIANDSLISTNRASVVLVYIDATKGWLYTNESNIADLQPPTFVAATGGTVTTSGDFKIHSFTGDGNFVVSEAGDGTSTHPSIVDYLVLAGGGSGGPSGDSSGGGGAGGFRESLASASPTHTASPHTASPLKATTGITVTATTYPVTVGGGGGPGSGSNSIFSTITSAGGGVGGGTGTAGGSGGGGGSSGCSGLPGGAGNTPPVSPPQGNNGGTGRGNNSPINGIRYGGGGGGAGAVGGNSPPNQQGGGGVGVPTSISGSATSYAGGAGAGEHANSNDATSFPNGSPCGTGGTGSNAADSGNRCGTANRGGGGGGGSSAKSGIGYGGKGIVIIRYKFQ